MYPATLSDTNEEAIVKCVIVNWHIAYSPSLPRDYISVVMEHVDVKSIWQLQGDKMPIPVVISQRVGYAVRLLHENNIVFGDLRDPDILSVV
jgi:tRNA A-37 threonylcarbamoyl transferase component Bud32